MVFLSPESGPSREDRMFKKIADEAEEWLNPKRRDALLPPYHIRRALDNAGIRAGDPVRQKMKRQIERELARREQEKQAQTLAQKADRKQYDKAYQDAKRQIMVEDATNVESLHPREDEEDIAAK